jgi:competence protein ComEC
MRPMRAAKFFVLYSTIALSAVVGTVWYAVLAENTSDRLTVAFLDIGQGDAAFIQAPNGVQVLIDGGPGRAVLKQLGEIMPFYDRSIDIIVATHPDLDHIGGLLAVLENYEVGYIVEPGATSDTAAYAEFSRLAALEERAQSIIARRGQILDLGEGVILEILFPDRDASGLEPNTASIVAMLSYGQTSFLFMGDAPDAIEKYLAMLDGTGLNIDVLKVGHHGSDTSTTDVLLGLASPRYAIISAGRDNRYGHPHREVLDALTRFGVEILRTDLSGTITITSDGRNLAVLRR